VKKIIFGFLVILCSCSTNPKKPDNQPENTSNYHSFDDALEITIKKVNDELPDKAQIAILAFKSDNEKLSAYIIEEMYDKLINAKKLEVLERSRTDAKAIEVGYQFSGEVDDKEIISLGHELGAAYVVTGQIEFSGEAYRLRVFAIDIVKGRRVASSTLNINQNDKQINYLLSSVKINEKSQFVLWEDSAEGMFYKARPSPKKTYRIVLYETVDTQDAENIFNKLKNAGFNPSYEGVGGYRDTLVFNDGLSPTYVFRYSKDNYKYRVVLTGIYGIYLNDFSERLAAIGFKGGWLREE